MALTAYRKKRRFGKTPEPRGRAKGRRGGRDLAFVIQKHDATRLHFDFRLELDGVMKSWAVPKGPSLDPAVKRMAVEVEDHPLEYNRFEGVIPEGEYGAGPVLLWDRGSWVPEEDPRQGFRKGVLKFRLEGKKLHGSWVLVRTKGKQAHKNLWLLIKHKDESARPEAKIDVVAKFPRSIVSHRTIEEIGSPVHRKEKSASKAPGTPKRRMKAPPGTRPTRLPAHLAPQLATLVEQVPAGSGWLHEIKYDGYRALCRITRGRARVFTRNGNDWTEKFAPIARAAARLPVRDAWLDGEIVVPEENGVTSFSALQDALAEGRADDLVYYVFDLPYLDGLDFSRAPLVERKKRLQELLSPSSRESDGRIRYSDHVEGQGDAFFERACRAGLEGSIAKRAEGPYRPGRGHDWLKVKCLHSRELAIVGYTEPEGKREGFGALVLGEADDGRLVYVGRVGTGFSDQMLRNLTPRLKALEVKKAPVTQVPRGPAARGVHWIKPKLVADVGFTERTRDGILRHPTFRGLREDKGIAETAGESAGTELKPHLKPAASARKKRAASPAGSGGVHLTNPDKILFPEDGITKRQLFDYYLEVQDRLMPYLKNRPLTIFRCPDGHDKFCFWEKHLDEELPEGLRAISLDDARTEKKRGAYFFAESLRGVLELVQLGALELHVWGSRAARPEHPDLMIFDVDPDVGLPWKRVVEGCTTMQARLQEIGLKCWLKTTGGKGMHVCVPLGRRQNWDEVKEFSKAFAGSLAAREPDKYTVNPLKARRKGRIFLDYLRNGRGATSVAAYSTRARVGAPVSMPLAWDELDLRLRSNTWTLKNARQRLRSKDPWSGFYACKQTITAPMRLAVGLRTARKSRKR